MLVILRFINSLKYSSWTIESNYLSRYRHRSRSKNPMQICILFFLWTWSLPNIRARMTQIHRNCIQFTWKEIIIKKNNNKINIVHTENLDLELNVKQRFIVLFLLQAINKQVKEKIRNVNPKQWFRNNYIAHIWILHKMVLFLISEKNRCFRLYGAFLLIFDMTS